MNNKFIRLVTLLIIIESLALYYVKKSSLAGEHKGTFLVSSMILYALLPLVLYSMLQIHPKISIINVLWNVLSTMYGVFIGYILFKENINSTQFIGIFLGITSIYLLK